MNEIGKIKIGKNIKSTYSDRDEGRNDKQWQHICTPLFHLVVNFIFIQDILNLVMQVHWLSDKQLLIWGKIKPSLFIE